MQNNKFQLIGWAGFSFVWIILIFSLYWQHQGFYQNALSNFQYGGLAITLFLIGIGSTGGLLWFKKQQMSTSWLTGLSLFAFVFLLLLISLGFYTTKVFGQNLIGRGFLSLSSKVLIAGFGVYFTVLVAAVLGKYLNRIFSISGISKGEQTIIEIGLGIVGMVLFLFLLGSVGLLTQSILLIIFILFLGLSWQSAWGFVRQTLFSPLSLPPDLNYLGVFSFYLMLLLIGWAFLANIVPFPGGWDALMTYMNIPSLIYYDGGLISNFGVYNWGLFMSLGFILFKSTTITMLLSFLGGFLSLWVMYYIARRWLTINYSLLAVLLFVSLPAVQFQAYLDMKIDLGLLFISLVTILIFIIWLQTPKNKEVKATSFIQQYRYFIVLGLLTGFALGTKFTAFMVLFAIIGGLWYHYHKEKGYFGVLSLVLFVVFWMRLDNNSGLGNLHNTTLLKWILLVVGIGFLSFLFIKKRKEFLLAFKNSVVYIGIAFLTFSPWIVKNYSETGRLSANALLFGEKTNLWKQVNEAADAYLDEF